MPGKNFLKKEMVSEEKIPPGVNTNSQDFNKKQNNKSKRKAAELIPEAKKDIDGGEIIHLGTRFITDDVPPRNYEGLKPESVIFLPNVTTLPSKQPAPVIEMKDQNGGTILGLSNDTGSIENKILKTIPEDTFKNNNKLPKESRKIDIDAFERGKLPSLSRKAKQPENHHHNSPVITTSISDSKSIPIFSFVTADDTKNSNFNIGLPTNLPITNRKMFSTIYPINRDPSELEPILQPPDGFSESRHDDLFQTPIENKATFSPEKRKINGEKDSDDLPAKNTFIGPIKAKPSEFFQSVESYFSSHKKRTFNGALNNYSKVSREKSEIKNSEAIGTPLDTRDKIPSSEGRTTQKTHEQVLNSNSKIGKKMQQDPEYLKRLQMKQTTSNYIFNLNSNVESQLRSNVTEMEFKKTDKSKIRFGVKSQPEIPTNNVINDINFRNHLESIIAKPKTLRIKSLQKKSGNLLIDGQIPKYKFLVEGIDIPKENSSDILSEPDEMEKENILLRKEFKGFSYIEGKEMAKQVAIKAAQVTARRPHEFVENFAIERELISSFENGIEENERFKEARANLHAQLKGLKTQSSHSVETGVGNETERPEALFDDEHISALRGKNSMKSDAAFCRKASGVKWNRDDHNIPHDTSRIFLRPHDKDMEQLRKLEEERKKSLRKKSHSVRARAPDGGILDLAQKRLDLDVSQPISEQEINVLNSDTKVRSSNRLRGVKQIKKNNKKKDKPIVYFSSRSASPSLNENSSLVSNKQFGSTGEYVPAELPDEHTVKMMRWFPESSPNRLHDGDALVFEIREPTLHNNKQKKLKHRRKRDFKPLSKYDDDSSEQSEQKIRVSNKGLRQSLNTKRNRYLLVDSFYSDTELSGKRKNIFPRDVETQIKEQNLLTSGLKSIKHTNRIITGYISVPPSLFELKDNAITGEVTVPKKTNQYHIIRTETLPDKVVNVSGSGINFKPFDRQVNNSHRLMDSSKNFRRWSNSLTKSMPTLESAIVDPELKKIDRRGGQYRVQMKLNAFTPGTDLLSENMMASHDYGLNQQVRDDINRSQKQRLLSEYFESHNSTNSKVPFYGNRGNSTLSVQVTSDENVLKSQINHYHENNDSYAIKSITPSLPTKTPSPSTIEFDLELSNANQKKMDTYSPKPNLFLLDTPISHQTVSTKNNIIFPGRTSMLLSKDKLQSQKLYNDIPNIVRGSILIQNSMDKNTGRRYLESFDEIDGKQDNNLFHKKYFQNRENPMYASDFETLENGINPSKVIKKSNNFPDVASMWNNADGFDKNVPIEKEWYYDHIWNSKTKPNVQSNKKNGAWKLKSTGTLGSRDWKSFRNHSTVSSHHVRQSIDVQKEEEELIGPLGGEEAHKVEENINVDAISEKVELSLSDGTVTIEVRVRCERVVPIRGCKDMFRKSAVVVTRKIEIDMTVSADRKAMYDAAVVLSKKRNASNLNEDCLRLSAKDTFELYCKLMAIADEASDSKEGLLFGSLHIDKELEEEARVSYGASSPEVLITKDDLIRHNNSS